MTFVIPYTSDATFLTAVLEFFACHSGTPLHFPVAGFVDFLTGLNSREDVNR